MGDCQNTLYFPLDGSAACRKRGKYRLLLTQAAKPFIQPLLPATSQLYGDSRYIILRGRIISSLKITLLVLPLPARREKGEGKKEQVFFNYRKELNYLGKGRRGVEGGGNIHSDQGNCAFMILFHQNRHRPFITKEKLFYWKLGIVILRINEVSQWPQKDPPGTSRMTQKWSSTSPEECDETSNTNTFKTAEKIHILLHRLCGHCIWLCGSHN